MALSSEAAIFGRVLQNSKGAMSKELARYLIALEFIEEDKARMHELAVKNQAGALPKDEQEVLENYVRIGNLLATLQSKARQRLKQ